jgi:hypothetical protein
LRLSVSKPEVLIDRCRYRRRRLAMRKVTDAFQHHPAVAADEESLLACRGGGQVAAILGALDHQRRRGDLLHLCQPACHRLVSRIAHLAIEEARAVGVKRYHFPIRVREAAGGPLELIVIEPAWRAPGVPLDAREPDWVGSNGAGTLVEAHQPLVPEGAPARTAGRRRFPAAGR